MNSELSDQFYNSPSVSFTPHFVCLCVWQFFISLSTMAARIVINDLLTKRLTYLFVVRNTCSLFIFLCVTVKVVTYSIMSVGHGAHPGFLAVSQWVTLVINPVAGCLYFSPGPRLLFQPRRSPPWPVPNYTAW